MANLTLVEIFLVFVIMFLPVVIVIFIVIRQKNKKGKQEIKNEFRLNNEKEKQENKIEFKLNLAGKGHRILNVIIDMISFFILWTLVTFIAMLLGFDQNYTNETGEQIPITPLFVLLPTFWGYYILTEYFLQKTLGKLITNTKVVTLTGDKPTILQIIFRTLSRSIPFEYFSYLATVEGIHDRLSKTRVIKL